MKVINVPVSSLKPKVLARREFGDLSKLAESIKNEGVWEPLIVSESDEGYYEIILGLRRYLAALEAGLDELPVIMVGKVSLIDAIEMILKEDILKKKLTLDEKCLLIAVLVEEYGVREVARRLGMPVSTVETWAKSGKTFAGLLGVVRSSHTPEQLDIKFKVRIKLAEKVCEAVEKAGYKGKNFKEIAGKAYLSLVDFPTDIASSILREWIKNPKLDHLEKLVEKFREESIENVRRLRIPEIEERVPIELENGRPFEELLIKCSKNLNASYKVVDEALLKIVNFENEYSGVSGLLCPRCNRVIKCRVCGSIMVDLCGYPCAPLRNRKYYYVSKVVEQ